MKRKLTIHVSYVTDFSLSKPGSTDAGKGQNFSMGHVREDHSNTLKV